MLKHTFQHLPGISPRKELQFWSKGITTWDEYESSKVSQLALFKMSNHDSLSMLLQQSKDALANRDVDFFADLLPRHEYYRIALSFPQETMFLDIETTGLSKYYDKITLVGWSLLDEYGVFIRGGNRKDLRNAFSRAKIIVTFNGSLFDLPFLRKEFPNARIPRCHVDLRFFAKRTGLSGGQKEIERKLRIKRKAGLEDIEGEAAALMWFRYQWGSKTDLERLIQYNHADVEGMKKIFDLLVKRSVPTAKLPIRTETFFKFANWQSELIINSNGRSSNAGIKVPTHFKSPKPVLSLNNLYKNLFSRETRIVGIDLTGSQERPSGWCLLEYDQATTKRIATDEDLIRETLESKPDIVSIDSPLSLPRGRKKVSDDDPGRDQFGIMRECERTLKKRGINVYPSLIPSMQRLTERGIKLANQFRALGVPVIESYPGAAQDILGIPRKRASLDLLAKGMERFGIKGNFSYSNISHDELDAITSAMVGHFFWTGKFEALGNEQEEFLIIPDETRDTTQWLDRTIVGLSGPIASGKTTAGQLLKDNGFSYARFSLVLKKILEDQGIKPTREALQRFGDEVNENPGQRWLCYQLKKFMPAEGNLVIDGLRFPEDHAFLRETFGPAFIHVHLDARAEIRTNRYVADGGSKTEFSVAAQHKVESKVNKLTPLADTVLQNNEDSLKVLESNIMGILTNLTHTS